MGLRRLRGYSPTFLIINVYTFYFQFVVANSVEAWFVHDAAGRRRRAVEWSLLMTAKGQRRPSPRALRGWLEWLTSGYGAAVVYLAAALLLTWPLALHFSSRLALGSEPTPAVPYFNLWTLGWNASWLAVPDAGYWDAPIFHPTPGAFAFSDPQVLTGLVAAPLWWMSPALTYNAILILFLWLDGVVIRRLLVHRGLAPAAALAGGLFCQLLPFLTHERGVLQLQPLFALVWALDEVWRLAEGASWRRGWALGAALAATFLTSEYYGLFLVVFLAPAVAFNLGGLRRRSAVLGLVLGMGIAAAAVTPLIWSQGRHLSRMGFERSERTVTKYSASPGDYARVSPLTVGGGIVRGSPAAGAKFLSPGWILVLLALLGLRAGGRAAARPWTYSLAATAVLAFLLSLGPRLEIGGWRPWELVQAAVPGFAGLRSPFRLAVLVQISVLGLAALGGDDLLRRRRHFAVLLLAVVGLLELAPRPSRLVPVPAALPPGSVESPAVFLPFVAGRNAGDYLETLAVMNAVLPARVRLVNGYSGFFPVLNAQLKDLLAAFPTAAGVRALRSLGVRTLLVRLAALEPDELRALAALVEAGELRDLGDRMELRSLALEGSALRPVTDYGGRWSVKWRWRDGGAELLPAASDLGAGVFVSTPEVAPLRWRARVVDRAGKSRETVLTAPGSFLLYERSAYRPPLFLALPGDRGPFRIELRDFESGTKVATLRIPERR